MKDTDKSKEQLINELIKMRQQNSDLSAKFTTIAESKAVYDDDGKIPYRIVNVQDITEQRRIEEELRKYRDHLEELVDERTAQLQTALAQLQQETAERKLAEEVLEAERRGLFSLLDGLPALIYLQAPDYSIRFSNRYFWEIFGKPGKKPCYEVLHGREKPCEECPTFRVFDTKSPLKWESVESDGRTYQFYIYPFSDIDGSPLLLVMGIDITDRKRAEKALQESESRLRRITDNMLDMISQSNTEGIIQYVSPSHQSVLGYEPKDLLGRSVFDFLHPDDIDKVITAFQTAISTSSSGKVEYRYRHADGQYLWLESISNLLFDDNGLIIGSIFGTRNITERKQAEEKLRTAHQQLLDIIEFLPDATFVVDHDKKVIAWNLAIEEMTGMRKEDIIGKGDYAYAVPFYGKPRPILIDLIFSDDRETKLQYDYVLRKGNTLYSEAFVPQAFKGKGAFLWSTASPLFDHDNKLVGAIQSIRDITQRKLAEKALRFSEERFSKAFNTSPNPMAISTLTDGRFIEVNDIFLYVTGYRRKEVIGRTVIELNLWAKTEDRAVMIQLLNTQGTVRNLDFNFRMKSGEVRVGLLSVEIIDLNGEQCMLTVINDITERKQLEKEMARLDRLHLIGEMAAGIGHEIRNPMTTVRGFLQMLGNKEECANYKEYYILMIEELDRANTIITEFLSLAKNKAVDLKIQNLNSIVEALSPLIIADAMVHDKFVKVELGDIPDLPQDEKEMRQLILNLVRNGLEAMSPSGFLTISTYTDGEEVVLSVHDQGNGIDPEVFEKIGTPFFTTKEQGTGLGLAVCYSIAIRHNATIKAETSITGTTFLVRFKHLQ